MGWRLSPLYDINPNPQSYGVLTTYISENDNSANIDLALSVAYYFDIKADEANNIIKDIKFSVQDWEKVAKSLNINLVTIISMIYPDSSEISGSAWLLAQQIDKLPEADARAAPEGSPSSRWSWRRRFCRLLRSACSSCLPRATVPA
jgi:hypothetical protein